MMTNEVWIYISWSETSIKVITNKYIYIVFSSLCQITEGEFLLLVSRGKLSHPPSDLFDLCLYYYSFYVSRKQKSCQKIFLKAFEEIYMSTDYEFDNIEKINRRFANCFFKAFVKKESSAIKRDNQKKNKMKRKLNNWSFELILYSELFHVSDFLWLSFFFDINIRLCWSNTHHSA